MLEIIRRINGPDFLFIYFLFASLIIVITVLFFKKQHNEADIQASYKDKLSVYHLAVLYDRVSSSHLLQTMLFKLWVEKYINIDEIAGKISIVKTDKPVDELSNEEREIVNTFEKPSEYRKVLLNIEISKKVNVLRNKLYDELTVLRLIETLETIKTNKRYRMIFYLLMLSLGVIKMIMGIQNNKPIGFLVTEIIIFSVVFFIVNRISDLTRSGKELLNKRAAEYSWVRDYNNRNGYRGDTDGIVFAVALMGLSSISAIPDYGAFARVVPTTYANSASSHSNSSCTSSGCSSSSCSSSGCSSGGCGGCGGGD